MFLFSTEQVAIIDVMQLPPRLQREGKEVMEVERERANLSRSTEVIMELRYGTWERDLSDRATMTCSRKWRERLMYLTSVSSVPSTPVRPTLSDLGTGN